MNITSALVLYAVIWFLTFYIVLQLRTHTQQDSGEVVPGTPASAPAKENVGRSALITTAFATAIWAVVAGIIVSGWITVRDFDFRGTLPPEEQSETGG